MTDESDSRPEGEGYPLTAWTRISRAADPADESCRELRHTMMEQYDKPLEELFLAVVKGDSHKAEDWKQEFLISHFDQGRLFKNASPLKGRFRNYLARSVANFINAQIKKDGAKKRKPTTGATTGKKRSDEDGDLILDRAESLETGPVAVAISSEHAELFLTRFRAEAIYEEAINLLEGWSRNLRNTASRSKVLKVAQVLRERGNYRSAGNKSDPIIRDAFDCFRHSIRCLVRSELPTPPPTNEEKGLDCEIDLFLDALKQPYLPNPGDTQ